ncbi:hypothetical protein [Clostridium frigoris]|uniref:ATP dependent DNA ligase n=1 Tax=Clostridium frigoris TaxID=205327 RepID=UPI0031B88DF5
MVYKGHVTMGISTEDFQIIRSTRELCSQPFNELPSGNDNAVWIELQLVCIVKFMMRTANGALRQPVFKGLRDDKLPTDCISN